MKKNLLIGAALILSVGTACTSGAGVWGTERNVY